MIPPSALPSHPSSLRRYLHSQTLPILQNSYSTLLSLHSNSLHRQAQARRAHAAARKSKKRGRVNSPFLEEEMDLLSELGHEQKESIVDSGHNYNFGYDLRNSLVSDSIYYGSWPVPPPKVVYALLQTLRSEPCPTFLDTATLESLAAPLYSQTTFSSDFEASTIAAFSAECRRPIKIEKAKMEKRREQPEFILGNTPIGRGEGSRANDNRGLPHTQNLPHQQPTKESYNQNPPIWR